MKRFLIIIILISIILFPCGCLEKQSKPNPVQKQVNDLKGPPLNELYKEKAMKFAIDHEFQKSLYYYKIVGKLDPEDNSIPGKIKSLEAFLESESERHFLRGQKACSDNLRNKALKEFLTALRYDPGNKTVFENLKNMNAQCEFSGYIVQKGDTLEKIAKKVYKDPNKDYLIAYFMDLDINEKPATGKRINFPVLSEELLKIPNERKKKKRIVKKKKYSKKSKTNIRNKSKKKKENKASKSALYKKGSELSEQSKYLESLIVFEKLDPSYKDVEERISNIHDTLEEQAEEHYRKGVKLFVNEELKKAIEEWEKATALNPSHSKAYKDIEDAKMLLEKLEEVK